MAVAILGVVLATGLGLSGILGPAELASVDLRFLLRGADPGLANRVAVVAIDARTDEALGEGEQFPIPRRYYAQALDRLAADGTRGVGIDVEFTKQTDLRDDNALIEGLARHPGTVLVGAATSAPGQTQVLGGADGQAAGRVRVASALLPVDAGATYRRFDLQESGLVTVPVALAQAAHPGFATRALGGQPVWIDFAGGPNTVRTVSFLDLIHGRVAAATLRGRTVLIGVTDPSAFALHTYSVLTSQRMSGVEVEANAVATALNRAPLRRAAAWLNVLIMIVFGVGIPVGLVGRRLWAGGGLLVLALIADVGASQLLFNAGTIVLLAAPLTALLLTALGALALSFGIDLVTGDRQVLEARRRAVDAGDLARHQVERDLHDGVQQRLVALAMRMSSPRAAEDPELLSGSVDEIKVALNELRQLARGTYPAALREGGLAGALTSLADHAVIPTQLQLGPLEGLSDRATRTAYFVAAEAVANAHKHAEASSLELSAQQRHGWLVMTLTDDGRGGADPEGSGLRGLAERAQAAGGTLTIHSPAGAGTEVRLRLPVEDDE